MKSVFLRRLLIGLMIAILVAFIVMNGGYLMLSRNVYSALRLNEMQPKADALGQLWVELQAGNITVGGFKNICEKMVLAADAAVYFTDASGHGIYLVNAQDRLLVEEVEPLLDDLTLSVLEGSPIKSDEIKLEPAGRLLVVGVPVTDIGGHLMGSVFLIKTSESAVSALMRLNMTLFLCGGAAMLLLAVVSIWGLGRVAGPLQEMSETAIRMSKGEFQVRADDRQPGEVGVLARALNHLCDNLSATITQLRSEKSQLDQLLFSLTDGVAALDGVGALSHYNPALMEMFGAVKVETRRDLISDPAVWDAFDQVYISGEGRTMTYQMPGDRVVWITISPVMEEQGVCTGVVGLFKDVTELERLESMRREYVANISHELRTPLTAVRGLLEPLTDGMVTSEEDRQRYYRIMLHEVTRLSRLITDMLTLSRLQAGREYIEKTRVDVDELITDLVQGYKAAAEQKGITLIADAPDMPDAFTDPDRVEQVLVILFDNAMTYTPEGGSITIRVTDGERLTVSVEDTGCGIPQKDLPYVFERFFKVDKSRKQGGTGLGLSIAKQIMDKLGEQIRVESEEGKGTCFSFTLKKFSRNIIALGPAQAQWSEVGYQPWTQPVEETPLTPKHMVQDAQYEVIAENKKPGAAGRNKG